MSNMSSENETENIGSTVVEHQQEELFKAKYPNLKPKGTSDLLQRRMSQKKYFDSGDYNMARAQLSSNRDPPPASDQLEQVTGNEIPTPEEMPRVRKLSQSTLVASQIPTK